MDTYRAVASAFVTGFQPLKAVPIKKFLRQQRLEVQTFPAVTIIPHNVKQKFN